MIQPQHIARIIGKHCKRESIKKKCEKKEEKYGENIILKNLLKEPSTKETTQ